MITAHRERRKKKREDIKLFYKATIRSTSESGGQDEQERVDENVNLVVLCCVGQCSNRTTKRNVRLVKQHHSGEKTVLDLVDDDSGLLFLKKDNLKTEHTMDLASNTCD